MARSLWKGAISFGLVSVPVELHSAKRRAAELGEGDLDGGGLAGVEVLLLAPLSDAERHRVVRERGERERAVARRHLERDRSHVRPAEADRRIRDRLTHALDQLRAVAARPLIVNGQRQPRGPVEHRVRIEEREPQPVDRSLALAAEQRDRREEERREREARRGVLELPGDGRPAAQEDEAFEAFLAGEGRRAFEEILARLDAELQAEGRPAGEAQRRARDLARANLRGRFVDGMRGGQTDEGSGGIRADGPTALGDVLERFRRR